MSGPEILSFNRFPIRDDLITIWDGASWNNGPPTLSMNAIIDEEFNPVANEITDLIAKNLKVNSGHTMEFNNNSTKSITVSGDLEVEGNYDHWRTVNRW